MNDTAAADQHGPDRQTALRTAVVDIERHVATRGWDSGVTVFSLVRTQAALATDPALAGELPTDAASAAEENPQHLLSIEQEGLPQADTLEELLSQLAWPEQVEGAALVVERIIVPPTAEVDMPAEGQEALAYLESHPERQDVRIAAGALRSGETWCALRSRTNDSDDAVGGSPDAVPGLVAALQATFN